MTETRTYPLPGSLGDEVFSSTEDELQAEFSVEGLSDAATANLIV